MLGKKLIQAASGNAAGGGLGIEDVFSTWLYTGNGSTQTITNGIDLAGEGGMVWIKSRSGSYGSTAHVLFDTARGANHYLSSNATGGQDYVTPVTDLLTAFSSTGFSLGTDATLNWCNALSTNYASWTFRKAPGFFDVVTFTAGSNTNRRVSHSLGSAPGMIIMKRTDGSNNWAVYHRSLGRSSYIFLNLTSAVATQSNIWGSTDPTSTDFGIDEIALCVNGGTYVAYLFAHDEQIFGEGGDQSVIQCGSFTTDGSGNATVNLGWEPQWVLHKRSSDTSNWNIYDNMRGVPTSGSDALLKANLSDAETASFDNIDFTSTGFQIKAESSNKTFIYIAIRRGPMKTPTSGTEVFANAYASSSGNYTAVGGFPVDLCLYTAKSTVQSRFAFDRLRGNPFLRTDLTDAEVASIGRFDSNTSFVLELAADWSDYINWMFRRAPGFFDVVAYAGTGSARTVSHNLDAAPELIITKVRSTAGSSWLVDYVSGNLEGILNSSTSFYSGISWNNGVTDTGISTTYAGTAINGSGQTYIAYLFATLPGISKVGSYTGSGTTLNVDCGFTAGARFVLIKRTDSTGDWYVWDTARGIVSGDDPYLRLNSTAAEVTSTDYIDPLSSGFQISSTAPAAINANGGSYIYLAIA